MSELFEPACLRASRILTDLPCESCSRYIFLSRSPNFLAEDQNFPRTPALWPITASLGSTSEIYFYCYLISRLPLGSIPLEGSG